MNELFEKPWLERVDLKHYIRCVCDTWVFKLNCSYFLSHILLTISKCSVVSYSCGCSTYYGKVFLRHEVEEDTKDSSKQ